MIGIIILDHGDEKREGAGIGEEKVGRERRERGG